MLAGKDSYFRDYLEAKMSVDDESLNKRVFSEFTNALSKTSSPIVLDVGTGTGAMIRRIIKSAPLESAVFYGIDASRELLDEARRRIGALLKELGFAVKGGDQIMSASHGARAIEVHLVTGDLFDEKMQGTLEKIGFTGVTSHAFMDIVPVAGTLELFAHLLEKGGLFYSTINYDGTTEFLPFFEDRAFEELLLRVYNRSMDERTVVSKPTGGSRTGSRLYDETSKHGFDVIGYGSSDWSVFPWNGDYSRDEEIFLNSLLLTMYEEGLRHPEIDRYPLSAWYAARSEAVEERRLSLLTHQTDLIAVRR